MLVKKTYARAHTHTHATLHNCLPASGEEVHQEDGLLDGSRDRDGGGGEGPHTSFSPSVKQFSAPRQARKIAGRDGVDK